MAIFKLGHNLIPNADLTTKQSINGPGLFILLKSKSKWLTLYTMNDPLSLNPL